MAKINRGIFEVKVYKDYCKACGLCVAWCPQDVLAEDEEGYPLSPGIDSCINCKLCERHCPDFAIEIIAPEEVRVAEHIIGEGDGL